MLDLRMMTESLAAETVPGLYSSVNARPLGDAHAGLHAGAGTDFIAVLWLRAGEIQAAPILRWILFVVVTACAAGMTIEVVRRRIAYIRLGAPAIFERHRPSGKERSFGREVFGQRKLLKDIRSGIMHVIYFYGFMVLQFGALDLIWKGLSEGEPLPLPYYGYFAWFQEITACLVLLAVLYGAFRRYGEKLPRLKRGWKASLVLWFIGGLMLTVLFSGAFERVAKSGGESASANAPPAEERMALVSAPPAEERMVLVNATQSDAGMSLVNAVQSDAGMAPVDATQAAQDAASMQAALTGAGLASANTAHSLSDDATHAQQISGELLSARYAPVSAGIAHLLLRAGVEENGKLARAGFELFWWLHLLILLSFMLYVPQSKHFHLLVAPVNLWYRRNAPRGRLSPLNLEDEEAESFGAGKIEHFSQKQLVDLYACVECGRCTNVCPAASTGKLLSPMHLMIKLRDHLTEKGAAITSKSPWLPSAFWQTGERGNHAHAMGALLPAWSGSGGELTAGGKALRTNITPTMEAQGSTWMKREEADPRELELIGDVMSEEELWACTTCRNCEEQCPVGNEHVDKIIDMRRHLVLMQGKLPTDGQRALQNIERQGNPWGLPRAERAAWIDECERRTGVRVDTMQERRRSGKLPAILLWAGSMGAYDTRSRRVLFDLVRLMRHAGLDFAALGPEERSSGDTARRIGNELLFQELCKDNIALLQKYEVRHIVTACPHTFNTLKNEYPDFGLDAAVRVEHHTELLARLVRDGRLQPRNTIDERVTIHDSCYLGRYNDSYEAPRALLRSIPGITVQEMERSGSNGMCCGAGGGLMWLEERSGARVNYARTAQALEVKPSVISSACPYCLTMMEDGLKGLAADDKVIARDVAELLAESVLDD
ncbi:(Fe-S)-binding protein [Paenibacillus sp. HB172176]|uniref:(Fe-S)-binding protein n=1 Tax=Paenibacillus sp. HB172176 TaxID=2493690 RepID=UPI001F10639A|nr:(Fe-S)-binding protein [Paenibacillus sp. HB172176]